MSLQKPLNEVSISTGSELARCKANIRHVGFLLEKSEAPLRSYQNNNNFHQTNTYTTAKLRTHTHTDNMMHGFNRKTLARTFQISEPI